jgi:N-acetyl-gamma-glutamyl-phosphate reductase
MKAEKIKVGVIGAGGYAGVTLISILLNHPGVELVWISSEPAHKGKKLSELYPHFRGISDLVCLDPLPEKELPKTDLVFLGVPHGLAMNFVPKLRSAGKKVVDLSADYRFSDKSVYEKWYVPHKGAEYLKETVYGLPELYKDKIKKAELIGNPGCYPTASILGAAPLVSKGLVDASDIIVDAKSGVSGAGRGLNLITHFPECDEGVVAYKLFTHRHTAEVNQEIGSLAGKKISATFIPHLIPMNRGILASIYGNLTKKISQKDVEKIYKDFYKGAPFVRVLAGGELPSTKHVAGTNFCDIAVKINEDGNKIVVISVIDNLVKGAAGQAVQNMNLMSGFEEDAGLNKIALYP